LAKFKLDIEYDYDFILIAICSHDRDYRFCWAVNKNLNWDLQKQEQPIEIKDRKLESPLKFSVYYYQEAEIFTDYYIIVNKTNGVFLITEHKNVDYFMLIKGNLTTAEKDKLIIDLKQINNVLTAYEINPTTLSAKQYLQF